MVTEEQIVSAIFEGTRNANKKYERWTGGWSLLDSGVESLMVCEIGDALNRRQTEKESLLLEVQFDWIKDWAGAQTRGRIPGAIRGSKRTDIALFNSNDQPVCIIEVKRKWNKKTCMEDLDRIWEAISRFGFKKKGRLRRGFLAVLVSGKAKDKTEAKRKATVNREKIVRKRFEEKAIVKCEYSSISSEEMDDGVLEWGVFCVQISLKRK